MRAPRGYFRLNCGNGAPRQTAAPAQAQCPALVHEPVCVQAGVTLRPAVRAGKTQLFCTGAPFFRRCPMPPCPYRSCTFIVRQNLCVQIPLSFSATAAVGPACMICGTPKAGPCPTARTGSEGEVPAGGSTEP